MKYVLTTGNKCYKACGKVQKIEHNFMSWYLFFKKRHLKFYSSEEAF